MTERDLFGRIFGIACGLAWGTGIHYVWWHEPLAALGLIAGFAFMCLSFATATK